MRLFPPPLPPVTVLTLSVYRVYTKKRGAQPDLQDPLVIKQEASMEAVVRTLPPSSNRVCSDTLSSHSVTRSTRVSATKFVHFPPSPLLGD